MPRTCIGRWCRAAGRSSGIGTHVIGRLLTDSVAPACNVIGQRVGFLKGRMRADAAKPVDVVGTGCAGQARSVSSAVLRPRLPSSDSHIIEEILRHAPIGVRARRRTISMRNCNPRRRRWSGCGNWRRNSSIRAKRRASKADGSSLASRDHSSKSKEKQKSVAACTFPARLLLTIVRKNTGRGKWAGAGRSGKEDGIHARERGRPTSY